MARITVEDCLEKVGEGSRFALVHLAVSRVKQFRIGKPGLIPERNKEIVNALREIAAGAVTFQNIADLRQMPTPEELAPPAAPVQDESEEAEETESAA
ncbi:MAG: DNA-directed RNA polymerase subunit omega [Thermodesulfobacteriota bacterium]